MVKINVSHCGPPPLHGAPHPGLEASHAQAQAHLKYPLPEATPDDVNVRHITILTDGDTPNINKITNSELFHCPFCKYVGAKFKVDYHVKGHSSVKHKEFTIIKCGLSCRTATHFHCCYCAATLRNRSQLVRHLQIHQEEVQAAAPVQHFVAPAQLPQLPVALPQLPVALAKVSKVPQLPVALPQLPVALAKVPQLPVALAQLPLAPAECSTATKASSEQNKFCCPHCKLILNKKNFKTHSRRKHTNLLETITKDRFLACQCIDGTHGVFAVEKSFCGPATPIHVIKNMWGPAQKIICEVDQCRLNADFAQRSGMLPFECHHIQSLLYCPRTDGQTVTLPGEALERMVENKWFGEERKAGLLRFQKNADAEGVPLSVHLTVGGPPSKFHISVYEKKVTYHSRLGRVIVAYDAKQNTWHCPCSKARQSCIHKAVAKWHLFVTKRELFRKVKSTEE
ncbi:uncharacterized protein LOC133027271 [Limanda limanda]|uniref:uncharacterized protein LOC133027271 n=1 Tax=Limanda limanda TaxID=27771 RepID=UPI0029C7C1F2|nr:uncharacterized protein LOC133027271 [Limanda limanda]